MTGLVVGCLLVGAYAVLSTGNHPRVRLRSVTAAPSLRNADSAGLRAYAAPVFAAATGWWLGGPVGAGGAVLAAAVVRRARGLHQARQTESAVRAATPVAVRAMAAGLRAGASPGEALIQAGVGLPEPLERHLRRAGSGVALGLSGPRVLADGPPGGAGLRALAVLWQASDDAGARLADAVERLADGLAGEERVRAELAAQLAGPRASAMVLATLPALGLVMAAALGARPLDTLTRTPVGLVCLVLGVGLDVLGVLWMRRIVGAVQP